MAQELLNTETLESFIDPIYKSKDGKYATKKQLKSDGFDDNYIKANYTQVGDTDDLSQEFQHVDGRVFSVKQFKDMGVDADRISNGIRLGKITPIEKKNQLPSTSGLQDGASQLESGTQPQEKAAPEITPTIPPSFSQESKKRGEFVTGDILTDSKTGEPYQIQNGEKVYAPEAKGEVIPPTEGESLIEKVFKYKNFSKAEKTERVGGYSPYYSGEGTFRVVPDQEKVAEANKIKEEAAKSQIDIDQFSEKLEGLELSDLGNLNTAEGINNVKYLSELSQKNPQKFDRILARKKWKKEINNNINLEIQDATDRGDDAYKRNIELAKESINNDLKFLQNIPPGTTLDSQREKVRGIAIMIRDFGGDREQKNKILKNLSTEFGQIYGGASDSSIEQSYQAAPESKFLNKDAYIGYAFLKDIDPAAAKQYEKLFGDNTDLNPAQRAGYDKLMYQLEQTGLNLRLNALNEKINDFKSKQAPTEQEIKNYNYNVSLANQTLADIQNLDVKYPENEQEKAARAMQEVLGKYEGIGGQASYFGQKVIKGFVALPEAVMDVYYSAAGDKNRLHQFAIIGTPDLLVRGTKAGAIQNEELVIDPEFQKKIDAIKNNKVLTEEQKETDIYNLFRNNTNKWDYIPLKKGKVNLSPTTIFNAVSDLASTLVPFFTVEALTAGLGGVGTGARLFRTFNAAFTTGFNEEYEAAVKMGKANPLSDALASTAISAAAMTGAGTFQSVKALYKGNPVISKVLEKMSDAEYKSILSRGPSSAIAKLGGRVKAIPQQVASGLKSGASFEAYVQAGEGLKRKVGLSPADYDPEESFMHSVVNTLAFGIFHIFPGQFGYKSPTEIQKASVLQAVKDPASYMLVADNMLKNNEISQQQYQNIKTNIEEASDIYKKTGFVNNKNEELSEKEKGELLNLKLQQKGLDDQLKKDLPEDVKKDLGNKILDVQEKINEIYKGNYVEPKATQTEVVVGGKIEKGDNVVNKSGEIGEVVSVNEKGDVIVVNKRNNLRYQWKAEDVYKESEKPKEEKFATETDIPEVNQQIEDLNRRIANGGVDGEKAKAELDLITKDPISFFQKRKDDAIAEAQGVPKEESNIDKVVEEYDNIINKIKSIEQKGETVTPTGAEAVPAVTGEAKGPEVEGAVPTGGERVGEGAAEAAPAVLEGEPGTAVGQDVVIQQMKPFTDEMVKIEREFENNNYEIRTDYDNEIIVTDKDGEIVDAEDLPPNLLKLAQDYEKAVGKLGEFDASAMEKALAESRKVEEGQAEVVETKPLSEKAQELKRRLAPQEQAEPTEPAKPTTPPKVYSLRTVNEIDATPYSGAAKEVVKGIGNMVKAVNRLTKQLTGKEFTLEIHDTPESYREAVLKSGGNELDADTKGFYWGKNNKAVLNLSGVTKDTGAHELFHPVLDFIAKKNPDIINKLADQLSNLKGGKEFIERNKENYSDYPEATQKKEAIVDYIANVASGEIKLDRTTFEAVRDFIINALNTVGINISKKIDTVQDLQELAKQISRQFKSGQELRGTEPKKTIKSEVATESEYSREDRLKEMAKDDVTQRVVPGKTVSTRLTDAENIHSTNESYVSLAEQRKAPANYLKNARIIAEYDMLGLDKQTLKLLEDGIKATLKAGDKALLEKAMLKADEVYEDFIRKAADNLLWLHNHYSPEIREVAKRWYDGANIISQDFAKEYGVTTEQAAGIIAVLSPKKDWYTNVDNAKRIMDIYKNHLNFVITKEMADKYIEIEGRVPPKKKTQSEREYRKIKAKAKARQNEAKETVKNLIGKQINDGSIRLFMPEMIRTYDETYGDKKFDILSPNGKSLGPARNNPTKAQLKKDPNAQGDFTDTSWAGYTAINKAIRILENGSIDNISKELGNAHKVRNFYNNIIDPNSNTGPVTVDTHAGAAAMLKPFAANDIEIAKHTFGGASDKITGAIGTYAALAEAYRLAAKEAGILPREMQSITWEAVRGLFTDVFKGGKTKVGEKEVVDENGETKKVPIFEANKSIIKKIWEDVKDGKLTINEARTKIEKFAEGIDEPSWTRPGSESSNVEKATPDAGELLGPSIMGVDTGEGRGTGELGEAGMVQPTTKRIEEKPSEGGIDFSRKSVPKFSTDGKEEEVVGEHNGTKIFLTKNVDAFVDAISNAVNLRTADKNQVTVHDKEYYEDILKTGGQLILSDNKQFGGYIQSNGYMGSLFKNPKSSEKGISKTLQSIRVENGGKFFDAYATYLEDLYIKNGFRPVARLKFNEEFAPEGWDAPESTIKNKPDVVFFAYDPNGKYKKGDGKYFEDWEDAYKFAKDYEAEKTTEIDSRTREVSDGAFKKDVANGKNVPPEREYSRKSKKSEIEKFIEEERAKGTSDQEIRDVLTELSQDPTTGIDASKIDEMMGKAPEATPEPAKPSSGKKTVTITTEHPYLYTGTSKTKVRGVMDHILDAENIGIRTKQGFKEKGIRYNVASNAEARQLAKEIIGAFGKEDAIYIAQQSDLLHPSVRSAIIAESIDNAYRASKRAKTKEERVQAAMEWKDLAMYYAQAATESGQFSAYIGHFYKTSPLGFVMLENEKTQKRFDEWYGRRKQDFEELWNSLKETEGAKLKIQEEAEKIRKSERIEERKKNLNSIDDFFNNMKDKDSSSYGPDIYLARNKPGAGKPVIPKDTWESAMEAMKESIKNGDSVSAAVQRGVDIISKEIGDKWNINKFKADYENAISSIADGGKKEPPVKDALKKRLDQLEKQIEQYKERIAKGGLPGEKKEASFSDNPEVQALIKERDELRKENEELLKAAGVGKYSDAERAKAAEKIAKKSIDELQRKLDENELEFKKTNKPTSAQLDAYKEEQKRLRKELEERRKQAEVGKYAPSKIEADKAKKTQERIDELNRRINEGDFSSEQYKPQAEKSDLEKERDRVQKLYDEAKKQSPEYIEKKAKQYIEELKKRLKDIPEEKKKEIIRRSIKKIIDSGGLKEEELKEIVAETMGFKKLTDEQTAEIERLVEDVNAVDDLQDAMVENPTPENILAYERARKKGIEAGMKIFNMTHNESDIAGTFKSLISGSLLSVPTLIKNVGQNIISQPLLRFPVALTRYLGENAIYGTSVLANMLTGSKILYPTTDIISAQKGFYRMAKKGINVGLFNFMKGTQMRDYLSETSYRSTLSPKKSREDLKLWKQGEKFLNKSEVIDRYIRASIFSVQADFILRGMALGDLPFRWAAEGAKGMQIAIKELGLTDENQIQAFLLSPDKFANKFFIEKGESKDVAAKKAEDIKKSIIEAGRRAVFEEDNWLTKINEKIEKELKSRTDEDVSTKLIKPVASVFKTLNYPFLKIPSNIAWKYFKLMNPSISIAWCIGQIGSSEYYRRTGEVGKQRASLELAKDSFAMAIVGTALSAVAGSLVSQGLVRSSNDEDNKIRETTGERTYGKQNQLNMGKMTGGSDYWIDLNWFGPMGSMLNTKAKLQDAKMQKEIKGDTTEQKALDEFAEVLRSAESSLNQLVFDQGSRAIDALKDGDALRAYGINMLNTAQNIITGGTYAAISKGMLPTEVRVKADTWKEEFFNNVKARNAIVRLFAGYPPSRISIWGDPIKKDNTVMGVVGNIMGFQKGSEDDFGFILEKEFRETNDARFFPPAEDLKITVDGKEIKLTRNEKDDLDIFIGKYRKLFVSSFVYDMGIIPGKKEGIKYADKKYSKLTKSEKIEALEFLYKNAQKAGMKEFINKYPQYSVSELEAEEKSEERTEKRERKTIKREMKEGFEELLPEDLLEK